MKRCIAFVMAVLLPFSVSVSVSGCNRPAAEQAVSGQTVSEQAASKRAVAEQEQGKAGSCPELVYQDSLELTYADQFAADYYEGGYTLLSVSDGNRYLVVPEGKEVPANLETDITVVKQPLEGIYLVATAVMDMFRELDGIGKLRFSSQKEDSWCIPEAVEAMQEGELLYAGKYNMPDYELIVSEGCSLAVENNMISHSPEVIEKLESFGIPVMIDFSSYESHPLGRVEWIKFYGALLGKEKEAEAAFEAQAEILERVTEEVEAARVPGAEERVAEAAAEMPEDKKTVAFFFLTTNGMVNVRNSSDYVPKMIELAGGRYLFEDLGAEESRRSSTTMQMEEFYHAAKNADYLIYNSTIDGELKTLEELIAKDGILKDFKAVQEGNVWCTTRDLYQQSMSIGGMIEDIHRMLAEEAAEDTMRYLYPLK